ncbi:sigma-70 family RNA polymerase sigma factor [Streptomyces sp. NPDC049687]|uniref:sigma-70 family RNA polymerase sigma factor n=1 Tax=Streptomyces sp. NPDC049687 TaxID=3365596 RepID=UPI0037B12E5B
MTEGSTAAYARIYEEQQPRLVAYARSLTRNAWTAEDLVAEAHFRVWRRLSAGHEIDNVPAYLRTTVRHLAIAAGSAPRETPRDPQTDEVPAGTDAHRDDPADQVSSVDLLMRVLSQLPERWVKALWLAEAEGQPLASIGPQLGTKQGATAVLLHRAREGMRQAYLSTQTGVPDDPACQVYCARMPAYVRGAATARQSERLLGHVDTCDDCRARLAALMSANNRLPALVGPALLVFALGGAGRFLVPLLAGSAGSTGVAAAAGGPGGAVLHGVRHAVPGASKTSVAISGAAGVAVAGVVAVCIALGSVDAGPGTSAAPSKGPVVAEAPVADVPVGREPVTRDREARDPAVAAPVVRRPGAADVVPVTRGASAQETPDGGRSETSGGDTADTPAGTSTDESAEEPAADPSPRQKPPADDTTPPPAEPDPGDAPPPPVAPAEPGGSDQDPRSPGHGTQEPETPAPPASDPVDEEAPPAGGCTDSDDNGGSRHHHHHHDHHDREASRTTRSAPTSQSS